MMRDCNCQVERMPDGRYAIVADRRDLVLIGRFKRLPRTWQRRIALLIRSVIDQEERPVATVIEFPRRYANRR